MGQYVKIEWTEKDASVVCKQLGFSEYGKLSTKYSASADKVYIFFLNTVHICQVLSM